MKLKITKQAKIKANKALQLRKTLPNYKKFGLDKKQAKQEGVNSGVERAKQLINNNYLTKEKDIKAVCKFKRWTGQKRTQRVQGAIDLWGGEKFINKACKKLKEK